MSKMTTIRIERELRTDQMEKRVSVEVTSDFHASGTARKLLEEAWEGAENGGRVQGDEDDG